MEPDELSSMGCEIPTELPEWSGFAFSIPSLFELCACPLSLIRLLGVDVLNCLWFDRESSDEPLGR